MMTWQEFNEDCKKGSPFLNRFQRKELWREYLYCNDEEDEEDCELDYVEGCNCDYCLEQQKERAMYAAQMVTGSPIIVGNQTPATYDPLDYILYRLRDAYDDKRQALKKEYGIGGYSPKSVKEMKEWLKKGYYYFSHKHKDEDEECYANGYFNWGEEPDTKGFEAVTKKLREAYDAAQDLVKIKTDEDTRLKALLDFQSATFS